MRTPQIVSTANPALAAQLDDAINQKTKPLGSLGFLEQLAKQIGLVQNTVALSIDRPAIVVFAGDHGVVAEGVSAYPQDVTWQMVENFLSQGAAINVFARQNDCALHVVDAGVAHEFGPRPGLIDRKRATLGRLAPRLPHPREQIAARRATLALLDGRAGAAWHRLQARRQAAAPLALDGPGPLNARYDGALAALIAERLLGALDLQVDPAMAVRVARANAALRLRTGTARAPLRILAL